MIEEQEIIDDELATETPQRFEHWKIEVDAGQTPVRIDKYLTDKNPYQSRNRIQQAADAGCIEVNGQAVKSNYKIRPHDVITLMLDTPKHDTSIVAEDIPLDIVYEDDDVLAFKDINPQAPVHIIVIPKKHIENILELNDESLLTKIHKAIKEIVREQNLDKQGFRLVTNTGENACQTVKHLHFHILGGDKLPESL